MAEKVPAQAALLSRIGPSAFAELRRAYVDGAVSALAQLRSGTCSAEETFRLVHDLKSGSSLLGLSDAAAAAAAVEAVLYRKEELSLDLMKTLVLAVESALEILS